MRKIDTENVKSVELDSLIGEHTLDGVDFSTDRVQMWGDYFQNTNTMRFRLDGIVYTAVEDPSDGYRSSMDKFFAEDCAIENSFPPIRVLAKKKADTYGMRNETLELIDLKTGKAVLEVGTDNSDDYYPCFVSAFWPENMATNV